jgi:hypothetical protein
MTYQEALDSLRYEIDEEGHCSYIEDEIHIAMKALEKQIPMKPDYWGDGFDDDGNIIYDQAKCPVCGHDFEYQINEWGSKFCQDCGQALDWSDNE